MDNKELETRITDILDHGVIVLDEPLDRLRAQQIAGDLKSRGFHAAIIELGNDEPDVEARLMHGLDRGFRFPDYFGQNWNAVDECINDLTWLPAEGYCCLVLDRETSGNEANAGMDLFVSVMSDASVQWAREGKRFCLVLSP